MPHRQDAIGDDDTKLVARACQGEFQAFESLVRRYRNEVYTLCFYFTHSREDAWDLSQEVFIKAYRALKTFRGEASFKTWLLRITANQCKDYFKKRKVETTSYDDMVQPPDQEGGQRPDNLAQARELGATIDAAVRQLPPKHQMAFILREYQGLSYEEMAKVMQCNIGTVMSRLFHARKRLQSMLLASGIVESK